MGKSLHKRVATGDAHTAFRYVAADKAALDAALAGNHSLDAAGLLAVQADVKKVTYLSTPGNPGTWTTIYPGYTVSASAPTVNEDSADGFEPGHLWIRTGTPEAYICMSNSAGAADWNQIDAAGGGSIGSGTDNRLARYDGTSAIQQSGITVSDADALTGVASINLIGTGTDNRLARYNGTAAVQSSSAVLDDSGRLGIGTTSPSRSIDVVGTPGQQLRVSSTEADATNKLFYCANRHYTNAEEDMAIFVAISASGGNTVFIGGGSGGLNSATQVRIHTAADTVTTNGTEALRVDADSTSRNTRLLVYDVDNATLERVSVGAADSGGAGFKVLRIPN